MNNKVNSLIQFAIKGGKIAFKQTIPHFIKKRKIGVIIYANDASKNTIESYLDNSCNCIMYLSKKELGELFKKDEVSIFGILDQNLSKEIVKLLKEEK